MKKALIITLFVLSILTWVFIPTVSSECAPKGCTALIAGRSTTVDGSILFAKTEDDSPDDIDFLWYIPRKRHEPGSLVKLESGGTIPQVEETYAYFWDQCPGTSFSNNIMNEWGVVLGSNACSSKEDPVEVVAARGDLAEGGLGFELRFILAERSKTAREAVLLAAKLLDTYGYHASGRCLSIVGPEEGWQLQMVRGKQYVARRVQDDEVAIIANTYSIREVDKNDRENFICSPRLIDYAIERGWYDPSSGEPFDFAVAYASEKIHTHPRNTDRHWNMARLLDKKFPITWQKARTGVMPTSVKPDRKLSIQDIMAIFRNHFEGTGLDSTDHYRISPHRTPVRAICCDASHRTTIVQQRNWLPPEIGTIVWRALEPPCTGVFVPWYLGIARIPETFQRAPVRADTTSKDRIDYHFNMPAETWILGLDSSGGVFKLLGNLVDANYRETIGMVRKVWDEFEAQEFELQPVIEETFIKLSKRDKSLAREYLTLYSNGLAMKSLERAKDLIDGFTRTAETDVAFGLFYFDAGKPGTAIEYFEKALELVPDHIDVQRYATWLRQQESMEKNPVTVPVETLKTYAGDYGPRHFTLRDGTLYYQREEQREFRLIPLNEHTFSLDGYTKFRLRFVTDEDGKVTKVIGLYFDGRTDESIRDH